MKIIYVLIFLTLSVLITFAQAPFTKISSNIVCQDGASTFGCVFFDADNDSLLDLFTSNVYSENDKLYKNTNGTFSFPNNSILDSDGSNTQGVTAGDYNNDGFIDLYVGGFNGSSDFIYQNSSTGFTRNTTSGITNNSNLQSPSWVDYDNDGYLDLFLTTGNQNACYLYHNNKNGTFTQNTSPGFNSISGWFPEGAWADYDNDGDQDVFITNNSGNNLLYRNDGGGIFTMMTNIAPVLEGISVGASWGDYDNDGNLDLFVSNGTNNSNRINYLYKNNGNGTFNKITNTAITADNGTWLGSGWADYDNDGDLDLFVSHTSVQSVSNANLLFQNNGNGSFTKITSGALVTDIASSRGISWGDIDKDGDLDLFITNELHTNDWLYTNNGNSNNWVQFNLVGSTSNRSAIGARVKIKTTIGGVSTWQMREIAGQTGYFSQNALTVHFGIGAVTCIDSMIVIWPSGLRCYYDHIPTNHFYTIKEVCSLNVFAGSFHFTLGNDTTYCGNFSRILSTGNPNTIFNTGTTAASITVSTNGIYWAEIDNGCGKFRDSIIISSNTIPVVYLGKDSSLCSGQSITLNDTSTNAAFLWNTGSVSPSINVTSTGIYWLQVTQNGCSNTDSISITFINAPSPFTLGNDTTYCGNFSRILSTGNPNTIWNTGTTAASITVSTDGIYWAEIDNGCGKFRDSIIISSNTIPVVYLGKDTDVCKGQSILLNAATPNATYLWNTGQQDSMISVTQTGNYSVTVTKNNCTGSDIVAIKIIDPNTDLLPNDTTLCNGKTLILKPSYGETIAWQDGSTAPTYSVQKADLYIVTVKSPCGNKSDSISVNYQLCECNVMFPTAFSPNDDGVNDIFRAISQCPISQFQLHIYNRWGQLVFESDDITHGWNGIYKNMQQSLEVYAWMVSYYNPIDKKTVTIAGNVTLIR